MEISTYADFSFRTLMYLASSGHSLVQVREISNAYGISENHLKKVVQKLAKHGHIQAVRGRNGGVRLAKAPERINLGVVYRQMEVSFRLVECFDPPTNTCPIFKVCLLAGVFKDALAAFMGVLDRTNVADLVKNDSKLRKELGIALRQKSE